jgi:hypothetical protein
MGSYGFGGVAAAPIWHDFMLSASNGYCGDFTTPTTPWTGTAFVGPHSASGPPLVPSTGGSSTTTTTTGSNAGGGQNHGRGLFAHPPQPAPAPPPAGGGPGPPGQGNPSGGAGPSTGGGGAGPDQGHHGKH